MRHYTTVECLYLTRMMNWQRKAPADGHQGILDGSEVRNTQYRRLAFVLRLLGAGNEVEVFSTLEQYSRRQDGESYITRRPADSTDWTLICGDWYLRKTMSMSQRETTIIDHLVRVGLSGRMVTAITRFVKGKPIDGCMPTEQEQCAILASLPPASPFPHIDAKIQ